MYMYHELVQCNVYVLVLYQVHMYMYHELVQCNVHVLVLYQVTCTCICNFVAYREMGSNS